MASPIHEPQTLERLAAQLLVCPERHEALTVRDGRISCSTCGFQGAIRDGVIVMMDELSTSFFDNKFHVMQRGHDDDGEWGFCYAEQVRLLEKYLKPGMLVLDVGCGPSLPYEKKGAFVIGLEPSFASIHANPDVDMRVFGSATTIPLPDQSVDMVVCFYSVHHFVGNTLDETYSLVTRAFQEFGRVIKPGGYLFVYEMSPMKPAALVQKVVWNSARKVMGKKLDMYFWTAGFFDAMRRDILQNAVMERVYFQSSFTMIIRPAFSLPELKLYRFLYPLAPKLFKFLF
jgi:ubiquinone/menaquinone biosynthesis C-methylase UbiE